MMKRLSVALLLLLAACADQTNDPRAGSASPPPAATDDGTPGDPPAEPPGTPPATPPGATPPATPPPPAAACTSSLGTGVTSVFGRLDGTVRAVIVPGDKSCKSDNDHVIVQLDASGSTYAVWVNVQSTLASDPVVSTATTSAGLEGPAWSAGWHASAAAIDYPSLFGLHSGAFTPLAKDALAAKIAKDVPVGAKVSAFVSGFATGDGGHKVHRNGAGEDGALVVIASGTPTWLLFRFSDQAF